MEREGSADFLPQFRKIEQRSSAGEGNRDKKAMDLHHIFFLARNGRIAL